MTRDSINIVICCDGTGNHYSQSNSNVGYFYRSIERNSDRQIAFYDPGVGTFGPFGWRFAKPMGKLLGAMFGYGVRKNIEQAYSFLMDNYQDGDTVFVLGFSRGAFTARSLASMLNRCGLLYPRSANLVPYVSEKYFGKASDNEVREFRNLFCRECKPHFIGVWDTVGSLGALISTHQFHDLKLSPGVTNAYHAVAIDEWRRKFPPAIWDESALEEGQNVEQVWFAGIHSDVGGGFDDRGLADITLEWMLDRADESGIHVNEKARQFLNPEPTAPMNKNAWWWSLLGRKTRRIARGAKIHPSVHTRLEANIGYRPPNLPDRT